MLMNLNLALAMLAGFAAAVVGAATLLLVWWQAPRRRENQVLVAYMAWVMLWGAVGFALNLTVALRQNPEIWCWAIAYATAINSVCTFWIAAQFAGRSGRPHISLALVLGVAVLLLGAPSLFSGDMIVLRSVSAEGLLIYDFAPLSVPSSRCSSPTTSPRWR